MLFFSVFDLLRMNSKFIIHSLSPLGGVFFPQQSRPLEPFVYSCRPGFRIWQADNEGTVHKTIIFKVREMIIY